MDDGIRERHGVTARTAAAALELPVRLHERDEYVVIDAHSNDAALRPSEARYLASKLYRLARRIEARGE